MVKSLDRTERGVPVELSPRSAAVHASVTLIRPPVVILLKNMSYLGPMPSIGLAYIVAAPVKERAQILQSLSKRHKDEWPQWRLNIEKAHAEYQRQGFVITQKSWGRDVNGVGVPMLLPKRHALYAFHCAGPASQMPLQRIRREIGPRLLGMISDIRQAMGEPPQSVLVEPQIHQP